MKRTRKGIRLLPPLLKDYLDHHHEVLIPEARLLLQALVVVPIHPPPTKQVQPLLDLVLRFLLNEQQVVELLLDVVGRIHPCLVELNHPMVRLVEESVLLQFAIPVLVPVLNHDLEKSRE